MKYVIITDSAGVELERHPLDGDQQYNETLVYACKVTAESQSIENQNNKRHAVVVDDTETP